MNDRFFIDTNVVVYALGTDLSKRDIAIGLLAQRPVVSVQVVNESVSAQIRKLKRPLSAAYEVAAWLLERCEVVEQSADDIRLAIALSQRASLSHWDALIVASAMRAGCARLYSEDMQHGFWVTSELQILNPFTD